MAKLYGVIGYAETEQKEPGIWTPTKITERECCGDLIRNFGKHVPSGDVNDDISIANEVSIVADPYATDHVFAMKYIKFIMPNIGGAWKIESAEIAYPRIILTLGGVYNGEQA